MKIILYLVSISFIVFSCQDQAPKEISSNPSNSEMGKETSTTSTEDSIVQQSWSFLADSVGGCLVGGQYCYDGRCGGEGCCFDIDQRWRAFFNLNNSKLSEFLITQLSDTSKTNVHVCPFFVATRGELAVYALQRLHKTNWYELDTQYYKYMDGTLVGGKDYYSEQDELQKTLADSAGLNLITHKWLEKVEY